MFITIKIVFGQVYLSLTGGISLKAMRKKDLQCAPYETELNTESGRLRINCGDGGVAVCSSSKKNCLSSV